MSDSSSGLRGRSSPKLQLSWSETAVKSLPIRSRALWYRYHGSWVPSETRECVCISPHSRRPGAPLHTMGLLVPSSYTHLRAHETRHDLVCRLLLEKKK